MQSLSRHFKTVAVRSTRSFCSQTTPFGLSSNNCSTLERSDLLKLGVLTEEQYNITDPHPPQYTAIASITKLFPEYSSLTPKTENNTVIELFSNDNTKAIMDCLRTAKNEKHCYQPLNELFFMIIQHMITKGKLDQSLKVPINILSMHRFRTDLCATLPEPKLTVETPDWVMLHSNAYAGGIFKAKFDMVFGKIELREKERLYPRILSSSLMAMCELRNAKIVCNDANEGYDYSLDSLLVVRDRFVPVRVSATNEYLTAFASGELLEDKVNHVCMEANTFNDDPYTGFLMGPHSIYENVMVYNMLKFCLMRACVNGFGFKKVVKQYNVNTT